MPKDANGNEVVLPLEQQISSLKDSDGSNESAAGSKEILDGIKRLLGSSSDLKQEIGKIVGVVRARGTPNDELRGEIKKLEEVRKLLNQSSPEDIANNKELRELNKTILAALGKIAPILQQIINNPNGGGGGGSGNPVPPGANSGNATPEEIERARRLREAANGGASDYQRQLRSLQNVKEFDRGNYKVQNVNDLMKKIQGDRATLFGQSNDANLSAVEKDAIQGQMREYQTIVTALESLKKKKGTEDRIFDSLKSIAGMVASQVIVQGMLRSFFQDKMQYETQPALGLLGSTGRGGQVLASGLGVQANMNMQANQGAAQIGMGIVSVGAELAKVSRSAGAIVAVVGALVTAAGVTGQAGKMDKGARDFLNGINKDFAVTQEEAMNNTMAQKVIEGGEAFNSYSQNRASLISLGRGDSGFNKNSKLGYNDYLNNVVDSAGVRKFGMSSDEAGAQIGALGGLTDSMGQQRQDLAGYSLRTSLGLGVSPDAINKLLGGAQTAGVANKREYSDMLLGASGDSTGKLTTFGVSVIAPAIDRAVNSMAVKNVSLNSTELAKNIISFRQFLMSSKEGNLKNIAENSPELFAQMFQSMDSVIKGGLDSPDKYAFMQSVGLSQEDMFFGAGNDPNSINKMLSGIARTSGIGGDDFTTNEKGETRMRNADGSGVYQRLNQAANFFGMDKQQLMEMLRVVTSGGQVTQAQIDKGKAQSTVDANLKVEGANPMNTYIAGLKTSTDQIMAMQAKNIEKLTELQNTTLKYLSSTALQTSISKALNDMIRVITELIRGNSPQLPKPPSVSPGSTSNLTNGASPSTGINPGGRTANNSVNLKSTNIGKLPSSSLNTLQNFAKADGNANYLSEKEISNNSLRSKDALFGVYSDLTAYNKAKPAEKDAAMKTLRSTAIEYLKEYYGNVGANVPADVVRSLIDSLAGSSMSDFRTPNSGAREKLGNSVNGAMSKPRPQQTKGVYGYAAGGYTGQGGTHEVAGDVHYREYVVNAQNTPKNMGMLNRMNAGEDVSKSLSSSQGTNNGGVTINSQNNESMQFTITTNTSTKNEIIQMLKEYNILQ